MFQHVVSTHWNYLYCHALDNAAVTVDPAVETNKWSTLQEGGLLTLQIECRSTCLL